MEPTLTQTRIALGREYDESLNFIDTNQIMIRENCKSHSLSKILYNIKVVILGPYTENYKTYIVFVNGTRSGLFGRWWRFLITDASVRSLIAVTLSGATPAFAWFLENKIKETS